MSEPHRPPSPLDPPMVPFALVGTLLWAVAGLALLVTDGPTGWLRICVAGFLLGILGTVIMAVRDRHRRRKATGATGAAGGAGGAQPQP